MRTRRIRPRHDPPVRMRKRIPRPRRSHICRPRLRRRLLNRRSLPADNGVQYTLLFFPLGRESRHFFPGYDGFAGLRVDDAGEYGSAVADGGYYAAVCVHVRGYALEAFGVGIVDERCVAGGGEEEAVVGVVDV